MCFGFLYWPPCSMSPPASIKVNCLYIISFACLSEFLQSCFSYEEEEDLTHVNPSFINSMVLSQGQICHHTPPHMMFSNVGIHLCYKLEGGCCWHLESRGQGCCLNILWNTQESPPKTRRTQLKMSLALNLRNGALQRHTEHHQVLF